MKIGVAGKGGSGKTTIAATLARLFARRGRTVNALDGDPNPNLAIAVGVPADTAVSLERVPSEAFEERVGEHGPTMVFRQPLADIVAAYGATGPDGVRVLTMTGLLGAGKGCICGQHSAVRGVVGSLGGDDSEVTILDMEASLEHLSRGTVRHVDGLLVVVEPYFRALETMRRTVPLARELGIPGVWAVANKIRSAEDESAIREYCARVDVELLGSVPFDDAVVDADRAGKPLVDHAPDSRAAAALGDIADALPGRLSVEAVA